MIAQAGWNIVFQPYLNFLPLWSFFFFSSCISSALFLWALLWRHEQLNKFTLTVTRDPKQFHKNSCQKYYTRNTSARDRYIPGVTSLAPIGIPIWGRKNSFNNKKFHVLLNVLIFFHFVLINPTFGKQIFQYFTVTYWMQLKGDRYGQEWQLLCTHY